MTDAGIQDYGGYLPRLRLSRSSILAANGWLNSALAAHAKGERAMCNWDEDAVTMAVAAARDCLAPTKTVPVAVHLASTSFPFSDRQNAGIVAEALNLPETTETLDVASSQRSGTSGLLNALRVVAAYPGRSSLFIASEHRRTAAGSAQELLYGDGAAAVLVGAEAPIARLVGAHTRSIDFVDHYRGAGAAFDYGWEERWIRDEGYLKIVPETVSSLLLESGVKAEGVDRFIMPCVLRRVPEMIAKKLGIREAAVADTLQARCGDTGAAHPVVLLVLALETARPGEQILVVGFGQGCDALLFEVTEKVRDVGAHRGIAGSLAAGRSEENYDKLLTFNQIVTKDLGKRAEVDKQTALTTLYRNRKMLTGFVGGRCEKCGTIQFPKSRYCVDPDCGALDSQADHPLADTPGKVLTWTADNLTFAIDPPAYFGMVELDGGGRLMVDFTDVDPESFDIGTPISMQFRIREVDDQRGFTKYFWKAVQIAPAAAGA